MKVNKNKVKFGVRRLFDFGKISSFYFFILLLLQFGTGLSEVSFAQTTRSLINKGVDFYKQGKYSDAEVNFKKGLDKEYDSYIGHFNLGDALYKEGRYNEALREYKNALSYAKTNEQKAKVFHNVGNALLKAKKIKESIGAYANALKLNPNDMQTKYNLSYALKLLKKQKNKQKQNKQNKNQKNKNQKKKQNKQKQQQQKQKQQQQNQKQSQQQKKRQQLNKEQIKRILAALKNKEAKLQKKLRRRKSGKVIKKGKDW